MSGHVSSEILIFRDCDREQVRLRHFKTWIYRDRHYAKRRIGRCWTQDLQIPVPNLTSLRHFIHPWDRLFTPHHWQINDSCSKILHLENVLSGSGVATSEWEITIPTGPNRMGMGNIWWNDMFTDIDVSSIYSPWIPPPNSKMQLQNRMPDSSVLVLTLWTSLFCELWECRGESCMNSAAKMDCFGMESADDFDADITDTWSSINMYVPYGKQHKWIVLL